MTRARLTLLSLAAAAQLLSACARLPARADFTVSHALTDTADTTLGRALQPQAAAHPGESGIVPLRDAGEAFAARLQLARAAERSIDLQYYIWRDDASGRLLFDALRAAADRGVRVRLLLDDSNTAGTDATLAALDAHPNIEVRLFNPFLHRRQRLLDLVTAFRRVIRRMHNKSFTVDNQTTIVGGRNIGDEYFGAPDAVLFEDLDVIAVGPTVSQVSESFDRYWASDSAWPFASIVRHPRPPLAAREAPRAHAWTAAADTAPLVGDLLRGSLPLEWAPARIISDDPAKGVNRAQPRGLLTQTLRELFGSPQQQLDLVSPYFVPAREGSRFLTGLAQQGVTMRILTNSLEATDVPPAHAGYVRRRKSLLQAGIRLYELRRTAGGADSPATQGGARPPGSSRSSLHAKTFAIDRSRIFVGSFNFDPRSALLNTEMGISIDSPALATRMAQAFDRDVPQRAYEVGLTPAGGMEWIERNGAATVRHDREPGTTWWQRLKLRLLSLLPLEWLM